MKVLPGSGGAPTENMKGNEEVGGGRREKEREKEREGEGE